jgi:Arc/MetJ-type ribon-helix-helix transcriptional regulator
MAEPVPHRFRLVEDPEPPLERISVPMSRALIERIREYRFSEKIDSHSEAIRRLIVQSLNDEMRRKRPT